ncbi:MAG: hypothetical protein NT154_23700 [Verrucomicrobia bacterium]|nr:hypothetical protein [Verrucomicrobiota bacterium]
MKALGKDIIKFLESPHTGGPFLFGHVVRLKDERSGTWLLRPDKPYDLVQLGRYGRAKDWPGELHHPALTRPNVDDGRQPVAIIQSVREVFGPDFPVVDEEGLYHEPFERAFLRWKNRVEVLPAAKDPKQGSDQLDDSHRAMLEALAPEVLVYAAANTGFLVLRHFKLDQHPEAQRVVQEAAKHVLTNMRVKVEDNKLAICSAIDAQPPQ